MGKEPKQIRTEIIIKASPAKVWQILIDFERYPEWNPFITFVSGSIEEGKRITAKIKPPGASGMTFNPRLLTVKQNVELRWLGQLIVTGLFDGEHIFELYENTDGTTTFI